MSEFIRMLGKAARRSQAGGGAAPRGPEREGDADPLGNQEVQQVLRGRGVRVSQPGDANEREATRIAASSSGPCAGCAAGEPCGKCGEREPSRQDLAGVRIHTDENAALSARALGANAYTIGRDIAFAEGKYDPKSEAGQRLLAHELVHTRQEPSGTTLHRDDGTGGAGPTVSTGGGGGPGSGGIPVPAAHDADTAAPVDAKDKPKVTDDPCAVNVEGLSNAELLAQFARATAYITNAEHYRRDQFYDYLTLRRRVGREREKRAQNGECWLADDITSVPGVLFRLEPGADGNVAISADSAEAAGGAARSFKDSSVLTQSQLDAYLKRFHADSPSALEEVMKEPGRPHYVDVMTAQMLWAQSHPQNQAPGVGGMIGTWPFGREPSPLAMAIQQGFDTGVAANFNSILKYQGAAGEAGFQAMHPSGAGFVDLNQQFGTNAPDYDYFDPAARSLYQVKTSEKESPITWSNGEPTLDAGYQKGLESIWGHPSDPAKAIGWREYLRMLSGETRQYVGPYQAIAGGQLVINSNDVAAVRPVVAQMVEEQPSFYAKVYEAMLWDNEILHNGARYTVQDFQRDLKAGTVPSDITKGVGEAAAENVIGGISREQVTGVVNLLQGKLAPGVSPNQAAQSTTPMEIEGAIGAPGTKAAYSGAAGNLLSGLLLIGLQRTRSLAKGQQYGSSWGEDAINLALTTPMAAVSSTLEQRVMSAALQKEAGGAGTALSRALLNPRALRIGMPMITAPAFTMAAMGLSRHSYPWQEYAVQGIRSSVNAGVSALATAGFFAVVAAYSTGGAEVGAVAGSVEPGGGTLAGGALGWLIGAGVGTVAYFVSDITIGDSVEGLARSLVGEPDGCK